MATKERAHKATVKSVTVNFVGVQTEQDQERRQHAANMIQELLIRGLNERSSKEKKEKEVNTA